MATERGHRPLYAASYLAHNLPHTLPAGTLFGAWVRVLNSSDFAWTRVDGSRPRVEVAVFWNGELSGTYPLHVDEVPRGAQTDVHFVLRVPRASGTHEVMIDLVQQGETLFSHAGIVPLRASVVVEPAALDASEVLHERALHSSPWHDQPSGGLHRSRDGRRFPLFAVRAEGCRIWDLEGQECIDYVMGWGAALLGYAHKGVQDALHAALQSAAILPLQHPVEIDVAERIARMVPGAERIVFGKNGSDVCTLAARVARAFTGRRTILFSGYHGWQDAWAEQYGFGSTGIPERPGRLVHPFALNDRRAFDALFDAHRNDLAAVMLEPAGPVEGEQGPIPDADKAFLAHVLDCTRSAGALLVFDEIFTGFRVPGHSVQVATGVVPDLTCLGKALGGGMPLSALGGRAAVLEAVMHRTHYGPTYSGEVYSLVAARAALEVYGSEPVAERVHALGVRIKHALDDAAARYGVSAHAVGPPFRFTLAFDDAEDGPDLRRLRRTLFVQELLKAHVVTYRGFLLPCYAHDDAALERTFEAIDASMAMVARARDERTLHAALEIPLAQR